MIAKFKKISHFLFNGGLEVVTPGIARTIIQPDSDVICWVSDAAAENKQKWEAHLLRVEKEVKSLGGFEQRLKHLKALTAAIPTAITGYHIWQAEIYSALISLLFCFIPLTIKPLAGKIINQKKKKI